MQSLAVQDGRLKLVRSPALPAGWVGKSHACWIGARDAGSAVDWLCFLDADVWSNPKLIASALQFALREHIDLLSLAPRHELGSFAERLMLPCGHYLLVFCQDLRARQSSDSRMQP